MCAGIPNAQTRKKFLNYTNLVEFCQNCTRKLKKSFPGKGRPSEPSSNRTGPDRREGHEALQKGLAFPSSFLLK
jgi:hypothetical protein